MKVYEIRVEVCGVLKKTEYDELFLNKEDAISARNHMIWKREQLPQYIKYNYEPLPIRIIEKEVEIF